MLDHVKSHKEEQENNYETINECELVCAMTQLLCGGLNFLPTYLNKRRDL